MLIKHIFATIVIVLLASIATAAPSVSATSKNDADATIKSRLRAARSTIKSIMAPRTRSVAQPYQVTTTPFVSHDDLETEPDTISMTPPAAIKAEDKQRYLRGDDNTSASEITPSSPTTIMSNDEVAGYVKLFNNKGIPVNNYHAMKALASIDDDNVPAHHHHHGVEDYVWKCRWFLTMLFANAPYLSYGFGMDTDTEMILDYVCGKEQEDDPTTVAPSPIPTMDRIPTVSPTFIVPTWAKVVVTLQDGSKARVLEGVERTLQGDDAQCLAALKKTFEDLLLPTTDATDVTIASITQDELTGETIVVLTTSVDVGCKSASCASTAEAAVSAAIEDSFSSGAFDAALATNLNGLSCPELTGLTYQSVDSTACADPNECDENNPCVGAGTSMFICFVFKVLFIFIISQISHCLFIIT